MKFGKRIQGIAQDNQRFGPYFVDYKGLKKFLKRIPRNESVADDGSGAEEAEDVKERFMLALESEVAKVESFFRSTLADMLCEFRTLCKRVNKVSLERKVTEDFDGLEQLITLLDGSTEAELLKEFVAFSKEVDALRSFVMTNAQATVKITKKHDKLSEGIRLRERYVSVLQRCTFYNSRDFGALIADIEVLATQLIEKLTGKQPSPDDFQCPICMHVLRNPLVLSCGHRFCNSCISVATYFKQHSCPVCRKEIVMDFQNLRLETLLSRFLRDFHDGKHVCSEARVVPCAGSGAQLCVLAKPCEQCAQWRSLHSTEHSCKGGLGSDSRRRSSVLAASAHDAAHGGTHDAAAARDAGGREQRRGESKGRGLGLPVTPRCDADSQHRPWTACSDIFRSSSKNLLRVGSGQLFPVLSPSMQRGASGNLSWSGKRDLKGEEQKRWVWVLVLAVLAALLLGCGTGLFASSVLAPANSIGSSQREQAGAVEGAGGAKAGWTEGARCEGDKSGVERLQEARARSLHKALDNLVQRSSKK